MKRFDRLLLIVTSGATAKALARASGGALGGDHLAEANLAAQRLFDAGGDAIGATQFVVVEFEGAREQDRVEREAVGRGEYLRVDDIGARARRRRRR